MRGNSWGLDFDHMATALHTNVGGFVTLHGVQGGYYWKQFGKHGALHNPYAFGFIDHVAHQKNFTGAMSTVGGIINRKGAIRFRRATEARTSRRPAPVTASMA